MYMPKTPMLTSRGLITSSASFTQFAPALDAYHENGSFREKEEGGVVISLIKSINGKKRGLETLFLFLRAGLDSVSHPFGKHCQNRSARRSRICICSESERRARIFKSDADCKYTVI